MQRVHGLRAQEASMKRIAILGLVVVGSMVVGGYALAGKASTRRVKITFSARNNIATGSLKSARTSSDSVQHIGCWTDTDVTGFKSITCLAVDASGNQFSCTSERPQHVDVVESIGPASDITFTNFPFGTDCDIVRVSNDSSNL
jgi:hypothetical protein